jgi:hypothetical protein
MRIGKPTRVVFTISTILAALAIFSRFIASIPIVGGNEFLVLVIAFILLWLGVVLRNF